MQERKISKMEFEALVRGFTVTEREAWDKVSPEEYSQFPAVFAYPEIFAEGVELKARVNMVVSADSTNDYNNDIAAYDKKVTELNEKYGRVAILSEEIERQSPGYGIIGYRFSPWKQITVTTYRKGKAQDVAVEFPATAVQMEDEKIRQEMGLDI